MASNRTYKKNLEALRTSMTPEQITAAKTASRRNSGVLRKKANKLESSQRKKLLPQDQLQRLDWRLGKGVGAEKERAKLAEKLVKVA